ncbi:hypothetical protein [Muriicola sp.]|uniref:hypothetical protein n=1 Tax=Muriicola sp. TaxID=2020856 RepID=UPI003C740E4C
MEHFEATNWSINGRYLLSNQGEFLYKVVADVKYKDLNLNGLDNSCNNDHGISPDGFALAISNNVAWENATEGTSGIYILAIHGGVPKLVMKKMPSIWYRWSPDRKEFALVSYTTNNK